MSLVKKKGNGFSALRTSRSKQASKAAADALNLKASRDTALQDLYRAHMGGIKCFNHPLGECSGGLEGAHRKGMESWVGNPTGSTPDLYWYRVRENDGLRFYTRGACREARSSRLRFRVKTGSGDFAGTETGFH